MTMLGANPENRASENGLAVPASAAIQPAELAEILNSAASQQASDIHLQAGHEPVFRIGGALQPSGLTAVDNDQMQQALAFVLGDHGRERLYQRGSVDGVFCGNGQQRYRFNAYRAQGQPVLAMRQLTNQCQSLEALGLPPQLSKLCDLTGGLILVSGPTGSGKTTTLASLVDRINQQHRKHIITIEDPIEFVHDNQSAVVHQRQVGIDTPDFHQALLDAVRQDPDVILVGEIRDLATIRTAIMAAETGHLVLATVHANDAVATIDRLLSVFPGNEQATIRHLLSTSLRAVIAQQLVSGSPKNAGGADSGKPHRVLVSEYLHVNHAVSNMIASSHLNQVRSAMETGAADGMYTLDLCLARLVKRRRLDLHAATALAHNPSLLPELMRTI